MQKLKFDKFIPLAVIALSVAAVAIYFFPVWQPLNAIVILAFLALGPGLGLTPLLKLSSLSQTVILAIALSLALDCCVTLVFLYSHFWSVAWMLATLIFITFSGALLQLRQDRDETTRAT